MADLELSANMDTLLQAANFAAARTSLGGTTVGQAIFLLTNPGAVTWIRMNADNTVTARSAANTLSDLGITALGTTTPGTGVATFLATPSGANLASALTSALPDSKGGTGLTALGTGVATFLGTPSSANLAAAVTGETGSGGLVFATSPTLVTPVLGVATATSVAVDDEAYDEAGWNGDLTVPTKNAVRDKIEALAVGDFDEDGDYTLTGAWNFSAATMTFGTITALTVTTANVTTLKILDNVDQSHGMQIVIGSDLTADKTLTLVTGDANRQITISGDVTLPAGTALVSGGALGTPSSGTATNLTGTASGLTAGNVTTNANLTGHITSTGNAAVLGSFTLAQLNTAVSDANLARTDAGNTLVGTQLLAEGASIGLDPAGSADGAYSGVTITGTGGATIAFGDLITLDKDDSRWELVDVSVAAAATGDARGVIGMAVTSSTDGTAVTVLLTGTCRADANFPALTIGAPVYATTAGDVTSTQPTTTDHVIRIIGYALTADEIILQPAGMWTTHT